MGWSSKLKRIRVGDVELRYSTGNKCWEIVKWYPNEEYNKKQDYTWDENKGMYRSNHFDSYFVSKNYFAIAEFCYVLAFLRLNSKDDEECDIETVGARPWRLEKDDREDYETIIKLIYDI